MDIADVLLVASSLLLIIDLYFLYNPKSAPIKRRGVLGALAGLLIVASYGILIYHFVSNHFNYEEVFYYSSTSLTVVERIYATWASSKGSWLLFTSFLAIGYTGLRLKLDEGKHKRTLTYIPLVLLAFLVILFAESPFTTFSMGHVTIPDGQGLNPLLLSPWMIIHPLVVFAAYALIILAFAATFDNNVGGNGSVLARVIAQWAWLFMTLGIALGGIWAYVVLGWGGYWAWDPVETGSLLPWLALTAYFHVTKVNFKGAKARDAILMVASGMVFFAGAITRGGFVSSVHAFGFSAAGLVLFLVLAAQTAYFISAANKKREPVFKFGADTTSVYSTSIALSFMSLIAIIAISTWGLVLPVLQGAFTGAQVTLGPEFFTKWVYVPTVLFALSLIGCQTALKLDMKKFLAVMGASIVAGLALVTMGFPSGNALANFGLPPILISLAFVVIGLLPVKGASKFTAPRGIIHLGVVLILIGVFVSTSMKIDTGMHPVTPGSSFTSGGVDVSFGDFKVVPPYGRVFDTYSFDFYPQAAGIEVPVTITEGGTTSTGTMSILYYSLNGVVSEPCVASGLNDVYITVYVSDATSAYLKQILNGTTTPPPSISVNMVVNPLVNVIWAGSAVMSIGILTQMFLHPIKEPKVETKLRIEAKLRASQRKK